MGDAPVRDRRPATSANTVTEAASIPRLKTNLRAVPRADFTMVLLTVCGALTFVRCFGAHDSLDANE